MKKHLLLLLLIVFSLNLSAQKYFKPKIGGIENVNDGGDYYKVEIEGKTSQEIYDAILAMVNEEFTGDNDEIIESDNGKLIRARGVVQKFVCSKDFDVKFEVEFNIKDGRYIFQYNKYNILGNKTGHPIVFQKGSNIFSGKNGKTYMFNKKGKVGMAKSCYKEIVKSLDIISGLFDISDDYDKYSKKSKKKKSDW